MSQDKTILTGHLHPDGYVVIPGLDPEAQEIIRLASDPSLWTHTVERWVAPKTPQDGTEASRSDPAL